MLKKRFSSRKFVAALSRAREKAFRPGALHRHTRPPDGPLPARPPRGAGMPPRGDPCALRPQYRPAVPDAFGRTRP